jgi:PAS domain S-box-containing protein
MMINNEDTELHLTKLDLELSERDKFQLLSSTVRGCEEFVLDPTGIIRSSNLEAITITGYDEWDVIGKHISLFYPVEDQKAGKPEADLLKTAKLGKYISSGFKTKKRGDQFWAKMKFFAIRNQGEVAGYRVTLFDSTHRAMYTMSTRKIKDEYLSLFNNSFIGIFKFSLRDYSCLMVNKRAVQIFGKERENLRLPDVFQSPDEFSEFIGQLERNRQVEGFEFLLAGDPEMYGSISCKLFPVGGFIEGIITDVTEKRKQIVELEKLNAELDNFLYHASHDIRSPLATILGLANLIKADQSLENIHSYTDRIEGRVRHLDSLLKDLSSVAFNNSQPVTIEEINPEKLIRELMKSFLLEHPEVKATVQIHPHEIFYSDLTRVGVILRNILSNAFKYSSGDPQSHFVSVEFVCNDSTCVIRVDDNGCGIDSRYVSDIFKLFFKMDSRGRGSGLGLYVVKIMVEKLGGKIDLVSEHGIGTCITLTLPNRKYQNQGM